MKIYANTTGNHPLVSKAFTYHFNNDSLAEIKDVDVNIEIPENIIALQDADIDKKIMIRNGKKPLVIINGKVISDDSEIQKIIGEAGAKGHYSFSYSSSDDKGETEAFTMSPEDISKIKSDAMNNVRMEIKKIRPQVKSQIRMANADWKKVKEELEKTRIKTETSKPEMEKAKAEMMKAKEEMIKAKEEMLKAKAEFEKERAKLKKETQK
ncbi:hypothetical protein EZL74_04950 [Flavobacterium silvisoli]|uniref:Uncharacterized protein n=1 Tax=Flavobacterium silvisoli TaxID=2529433 RepID=A0A4Q9Z1G7_9FLAO|nr:hypothetical protein [Flavobacterium silvisoli]TBX70095.1 hypothetical protein EZL74_04950 [Flavobacterium silvisoli]